MRHSKKNTTYSGFFINLTSSILFQNAKYELTNLHIRFSIPVDLQTGTVKCSEVITYA